MKEVITHMPLSPRINPELGYYGIHTQAHIISNLTEKPYLFTGNELGSKKGGKIEGMEGVLDDLRRLDICVSKIWKDGDASNISFIQDLISTGVNNGLISMEMRETFLCPCGKTEFPNLPENLSGKQEKTTYEIKDGIVICKVCGGQAILQRSVSLIMKLPDEADFPFIKIYPPFAQSEIREHLNFFAGKDYILSRSSPREVAVSIGEERFWVDSDFYWIPFICHLQQEMKIKVEVLLTGHKTLKQVALSLLMAKRLGAVLPEIVIATPYININFGERPRLKTEEFLSKNGSGVTRLFLGQTLGADRKLICLQSSEAYLIARALENLPSAELERPTGEKPPLENFLHRGNSCRIRGISKKLRRRGYEQLENIERWLLWAILHSNS